VPKPKYVVIELCFVLGFAFGVNCLAIGGSLFSWSLSESSGSVSLLCSLSLGGGLRLDGSVVVRGLACLLRFGLPSALLNIALIFCSPLDALLLLLPLALSLLLVSTNSCTSGVMVPLCTTAIACTGAAGAATAGAGLVALVCIDK
jgi:hypothetical protein